MNSHRKIAKPPKQPKLTAQQLKTIRQNARKSWETYR